MEEFDYGICSYFDSQDFMSFNVQPKDVSHWL